MTKFMKKLTGLALGLALITGVGVGVSATQKESVETKATPSTYTKTFSYGLSDWSLTNYEDKSSYYLIPSSTTPSVASLTNVFKDKNIVSNITITINNATFGSGDNPTSSNYNFYSNSECSTAITVTKGGTYPSSSTFVNSTFTISSDNVSSLSDTLYIKFTKPGKQLRLKSIKVEYNYEEAHDPSISLDKYSDTGLTGGSTTITATPSYFTDTPTFAWSVEGSDNVISLTNTDSATVTVNYIGGGTASAKCVATYNTESANASCSFTITVTPTGVVFVSNEQASFAIETYDSYSDREIPAVKVLPAAASQATTAEITSGNDVIELSNNNRFNILKVGTATVKIYATGHSSIYATLSITINADSITNFRLKSGSAPVTQFVGQTFNSTGLKFEKYYSGKKSWNVASSDELVFPETTMTKETTSVTVGLKNTELTTVVQNIVVKEITAGKKYFILTNDNYIFMAKSLNGATSASSSSRTDFHSSAVVENGRLKSIEGITESSLEAYAWDFIAVSGKSNTFYLKNTDSKYFNIYTSGSFYIDSSSEEFAFSGAEDGCFNIYSNKTKTYFQHLNNSWSDTSAVSSDGLKFYLVEYKSFDVLDKIEVTTTPKTNFFKNDSFDSTGLVVTATDTNGATKDVSNDVTITPPDMSTVGEKTVTISYTLDSVSKETSYDIQIINTLNSIEISGDSTTTYNANEITIASEDTPAGISINSTKGSGTSNPYRPSTSLLRLYKGNTLKVNSTSLYITKIMLYVTITDGKSFAPLTADVGTYVGATTPSSSTVFNVGTWTGNNKAITFTVGTGQVQIQKIVVTTSGTINLANSNYQAQKDVIEFAEVFMDTMDEVCGQFDTKSSAFTTAWELVAEEFAETFPTDSTDENVIFAKNMFKYATAKIAGTASSDILQNAMYRYDLIIARDSSLDAFIVRNNPSELMNNKGVLGSNNDTTIAIVAVVSLIGVSAIGGYFFIRKTKHE